MVEQRRDVAQGESAWCLAETTTHFGLGDATVVDQFKIYWSSGQVSEQADVPINRLFEVDEFEDGYPIIRMNGQFSASGLHEFRSDAPVQVSIDSQYPIIFY